MCSTPPLSFPGAREHEPIKLFLYRHGPIKFLVCTFTSFLLENPLAGSRASYPLPSTPCSHSSRLAPGIGSDLFFNATCSLGHHVSRLVLLGRCPYASPPLQHVVLIFSFYRDVADFPSSLPSPPSSPFSSPLPSPLLPSFSFPLPSPFPSPPPSGVPVTVIVTFTVRVRMCTCVFPAPG